MAAGRKDIYKDAKPFKKGTSGNPNGRPKGVPNAATRMRRFLELETRAENPITNEFEGLTIAEQMDLQVISKALKGDLAAWEKILDRLEGKPKQTTEHAGEIAQNINIENLSLEDRKKALALLKKADISTSEDS